MPIMNSPSISLLRALRNPFAASCQHCQVRNASNKFMPRSNYAKVTRLDKLHRQQKAELRKEREESHLRANAMDNLSLDESVAVKGDKPSAFPFSIGRTRSSNLPIYQTTKAGGSKHITQLRRLQGDLDALQNHLRTLLQLPDHVVDNKGRKKETVAINRTTRHIIIRGWRGPEIKKWAEMSGF